MAKSANSERTEPGGSSAPPCQLGLDLQFLEEDGGRIAAHLHRSHPFVMLFLNGGIPEHGLEFSYEFVPMWISESGAGGISVVIDPKCFASVGPPVLGTLGEERGGTDHHERRDSPELVAVRLKVGVTVAEELFHIIVLPFKGFG